MAVQALETLCRQRYISQAGNMLRNRLLRARLGIGVWFLRGAIGWGRCDAEMHLALLLELDGGIDGVDFYAGGDRAEHFQYYGFALCLQRKV
jgi:hypothetical protein